jgi:hypothetical protein
MGGAAVGAALVLMAGTASAHECFNASRSAQADAEIAQHAHGWFDIHTSQFVAIFVSGCIQTGDAGCPITTTAIPGLANADIAYIQDPTHDVISEILGFAPASMAVTDLLAFTNQVATAASTCGVPLDYLTKPNSTAAGGAPTKVVTNGVGIDHFPDVYGGQLVAAYNAIYNNVAVVCP